MLGGVCALMRPLSLTNQLTNLKYLSLAEFLQSLFFFRCEFEAFSFVSHVSSSLQEQGGHT